jgi:hypothetical protein
LIQYGLSDFIGRGRSKGDDTSVYTRFGGHRKV